ncbi:MAG: 30S ribosome-binding factor RbfA [Chlamydiae bacterium]|jgi:ribosome-binding factor A|nr:30S ribosome-binding factor RbfA [Chlamydiota bacterium]
MSTRRVEKLNSLLKEVISEVILRDVKNPHVSSLITVTKVDIAKDLRHAKVYISVIGNEEQKKETFEAIRSASGFIAVHAAKKVVMRYFPELHFKLDTTLDERMKIDSILKEIEEERESRNK